MAPGRARRPGGGEVAEGACPFCRGNEHLTPPAALELGEPWRVRVVPNLYPALERQEVVVHAPDHVTSFADLDPEQVALVAQAWRARAEAVPGYLHAFVNEGREAGASRAHSHSQLAWLPEPPPEVAREVGRLDLRDELVVLELDGVVAAAAAAPRQPYELVIAPVERSGDAFAAPGLEKALRLLKELVGRLRALGAAPAWNAWLHQGAHWHLELVPRVAVPAGLELGAGVHVSTLAPEGAAQALRAAS